MSKLIRILMSAVVLSMMITSTLPALSTSAEDSTKKEFVASSGDYTEPSNFRTYYNYKDMESDLRTLAERYPDICELHKLTQTYEGRYVYAMKISDNPGIEEESEPDVLIIGAHHAREWPSFEAPMYYIFYLLENYGNISRVTWLVDNREIWIIPMLNPDGVEYDRSLGGGVWRKNREPNYLSETVGVGPLPDPELVPVSYGTDLNRNYGYRWGYLGGSQSHVSYSSQYVGPPDTKDDDGDGLVNEDPMDDVDNDRDGLVDEDPAGGFSTAETRAVRDLALSHHFQFSLCFHTYSELVLWPWGWTTDPAPDAPYLERAGMIMANMTGYTGEQASTLYPTDGDSDDWLYAKAGVYPYTIEIGTQFVAPEEDIIPICENMLGPQLFLSEEADNRKLDLPLIRPLSTPNSTANSSVVVSAMVYDRGGILGVESELPHISGKKSGMKLYYSTGGAYKSISMDEYRLENGTLAYSAVLPMGDASEVKYYFSFTDPFGRVVTGPRYAPYEVFVVKREVTPLGAMNLMLAIIMAVFVYSIIWGGFGFSIKKAIEFDARKKALEVEE